MDSYPWQQIASDDRTNNVDDDVSNQPIATTGWKVKMSR
jgi:hypothetical protein